MEYMNHARLLFTRKSLRAKIQVGIRTPDDSASYRCATVSDLHRLSLCVPNVRVQTHLKL